ncbi:MAG: class I SAM-dependent methyltransferase [Noviherbaspirillum sp.]
MSPDAYLEMAATEERHWWFAGRRSVLSWLIAKLDLPVQASILEIGSGTGGNLPMLSAFGKVSAMELDEVARGIAMQKTNGRFDIRAGSCPAHIPFAGERFDLVCLFDVLEHIEDDVATLSAIKALSAKEGRVLVTVPAYRWLWSGHDEFLHHKRRYVASELQEKIASAGLRVEKISYFNTLLFPLAAAVRIKDRLFRSSSPSGTALPPSPVNTVLRHVFGAERFLLDRLNLPFGVSLVAVLRA